MEYAIVMKDVKKQFDLKQITFYGGSSKIGKKIVLDGFNIEIKKGEIVGLVGANGSGKSTLLKIISKIMYPDSGDVKIYGSVASILELGMGFEPDLSGIENIRYKCGLFGFSERDIKRIEKDIVDFSELGDQIDMPLKTYSSGMITKLAFSVLKYVNNDIIVIDEALSVGDASFKLKCKTTFNEFRKKNKTVILASHDISTLEAYCDRVCWILDGKVKEIGLANTVCYHYISDSNESPISLKRLSDQGDSDATNKLGTFYRDGYKVEANLDEAKKLFKKAVTVGNSSAMINLGDIYAIDGLNEKAKELYQKALDLGNQMAIHRLYSIDVDSDYLIDLNNLIKSGNTRAISIYADAAFDGGVMSQNYNVAFDYYKKASENGNLFATYRLAVMYREGQGVKKDIDKSIVLFESAANIGFVKAIGDLVYMYRRGYCVERNVPCCIHWLKKLASMGDVNAMKQIGILLNETPIPGEFTSEHWFNQYMQGLKSVEQYNLADALMSSCNYNNYKRGIMWFKKSAMLGNVKAMYRLAVIYRDGIGSISKPDDAYYWFKKSADLYYVPSMIELGNMALHSNVKEKLCDAVKYYTLAAKHGASKACYSLGLMYRDGVGVDIDLEKSERLLTYSSEFGNVYANSELRYIHP